VLSFDGLTERTGPLSWSQRWTWDIIQELVPHEQRIDYAWTTTVPPGRSADDVLAVVLAMLTQHETLRSHFRVGPDDEPEQSVQAAGAVPVEVRAASTEDAAAVAARLQNDLHLQRFDLAKELPVRLGLVMCRQTPAFLVVTLSNLAVDGWSLALVWQELNDRLAGDQVAPAGLNPLDQVAFERGEAGRRVARDGLKHWQDQLAAVHRVPDPAWRPAGEQPRFWCGEFSSTALADAAHIIARRGRTQPSAVLLAGLAALAGWRLGQPALGLFIVASNRYRPESRRSVSKYMQSSPLCLELLSPTFDELVRTAAAGLLRASRFGQVDPVELSPLIHGPGPHRGAHLALPVVFDFHHQQQRQGPADPIDLDALRRTAVRSRFGWSDTVDHENFHLFIQVNECAEEAQITFWIDTHYLSRADLAAVVFGTERLLIEAVGRSIAMSDLGAVTGVAPGAGR
jgi:hypothetical protein